MIKLVNDLVDITSPNQIVNISEDGLHIFLGKGNNRHVRTNLPIPNHGGGVYYEYKTVKMTTNSHTTVCNLYGVSSLDGKNASYYYPWIKTSTSKNNFIFNFSNGTFTKKDLGASYHYTVNLNDIIGLAVYDTNFIIYRNGSKLVDVPFKISGEVYPAFYTGTIGEDYEIDANFGLSPLSYIPSDCISLEQAYKNLYKDNELKIY